MKSWIGPAQVLAAGCCFGFLGIFGKLAFRAGLSVGELLTWRFALASILLGTFLALKHPTWLQIGLKQTLISFCLGIFGYAVFSTLYFESVHGVTVGLAALLLFTFPIYVTLGSFLFLRERLSKYQIISLCLASGGLVFLVWGDWSVQQISAVAYGLGSGITYAAYVLVSGRAQKNVRPLSSSFFVILGAFFALAVFHHPSMDRLAALNISQAMIIVGIALVSTIAPLTLFLAGLQKMPSSHASILVMIEPVVAAALGAIFFREFMTPLQLSGAALILSAMLLQSWKTRPSMGLS